MFIPFPPPARLRDRASCRPLPGVLITLLATSSLFIAVGCSGGKDGGSGAVSANTAGRATLSVRWPGRGDSRLIPFAADSIRIRLTSVSGSALLGEALLVRPASGGLVETHFDRLAPGSVTVEASAHPGGDGSGVAQAQARTSVTIIAGQVAPVRLTLTSTIQSVEVTPATVTLAAGQTAPLSATAKNAAGEVVLTQSRTWEWSSETPTVATVDVAGLVRAVAPGTTRIQARETESGKSASVTVQVGSTSGSGTLLIYDGFDYPEGTGLAGKTGGTGWRNPWNEYGQGHTASVIEGSGLTFPGLQTTGRAVRTTSRRPVGHARVPETQLGITGSVLYASILARPVDALNVGWPDTYFSFGFSDMYVGKPGQHNFFSVGKGYGNMASTTTQAERDKTAFLVFRVTFRDGGDIVEMWVNPTPGQPLPAPAAVKSDIDVSLPGDIGIGSSIPTIFDEYRIGTTWESVSPTLP